VSRRECLRVKSLKYLVDMPYEEQNYTFKRIHLPMFGSLLFFYYLRVVLTNDRYKKDAHICNKNASFTF